MAVPPPFLTVFIPAYNEEANLENCVQVVLAKLEALGVSAEALIVDDGSRDGTAALADRLAQQSEKVRVVHHPENRGIGGAFVTAAAQARGEWLILIPADLALEPDELRRYLQAAAGADVVVGLRSDRADYTWLRRLVSWTNIFLVQRLFGMKERQFQYISMYRMEVLRQIQAKYGGADRPGIRYWRSAFFLAEVLIKARRLGYRLVEVEDVRYVPRQAGRATGAHPRLVLRTLHDLLHFWLTGLWRHS
jgi:glycosyltransferase involved in cell wall biosynthesis